MSKVTDVKDRIMEALTHHTNGMSTAEYKALPSRLLEQAHVWVVALAVELSLTRPNTQENIAKRERLLTALDDAIVRYQRRAALLALRG